jgi:Arc/MetJ family transcription regulator
MRTNIVLDETLVEKAKALTGIKTTRAVIDEALRMLVQLREQGQVRDLRGGLRWDGDLAAQRAARFGGYEAASEGQAPHVAD